CREVFRKFKAKCAERDLSMGEGFNSAAKHWAGGLVLSKVEEKGQRKDLHILNDLGGHLHELHRKSMEKKK
ncbi:MAG: hypothetical protein ABIG96_01780, partial [Candidatus Micrarchaeota archaeon]